MANFVYTQAKADIAKALIDFDAPDDFRVLLLKTITDAAASQDDADLATVLARAGMVELVDGSYSRHSLAGDTVTQDNANNRAEIDWTDPVFSALSGGETIVGFLVFKFVTNDAGSTPIAFFDTDSAGAISITTNGSDVTIAINVEGLLQLA